MKWITIAVLVPREATDLVATLLSEYGSHGAVIDDPELKPHAEDGVVFDYVKEVNRFDDGTCTITGYFPIGQSDVYPRLDKRLSELTVEKLLPEYSMVTYESDDGAWLYEWQKFFHPKEIAPHVVVKPSWESYEGTADDVIIEIDPGLAFGTGFHETTALCTTLLAETMKPSLSVIDIGTGTGILAIVAAKLGAKDVLAVDLDQQAVKVARENISRNNVTAIVTVKENNLLDMINIKADIVVANIVADVIIGLLPSLCEHMNENGYFIASGIIDDRIDDVRRAISESLFIVDRTVNQNGWYALRLRKK
jgi:ribosomal protein L11 methyltransferase